MENADMTWRKSTYSANGGGECIEVANNIRNVMVRDTKQDGMGDARTVLSVPVGAWERFIDSVR